MITKPAADNRTILICSSYYGGSQAVDRIDGVLQNVSQLEECLSEFSDVVCIVDEEDPSGLLQRVEDRAREADNTLLLYYSGHGFLIKENLKKLLYVSGEICPSNI